MKLSKKVVLLGHFGVGKTSLFRRFIDDAFSEDYKVTLGVQVKKKTLSFPDGQELALVIWDTEGHQEIEDTRKSYLLGSNAFIYVYDLTRPDTYEDIHNTMQYLKKEHPKMTIKIIGNKLDKVSEKETKQKLKEQNIPFDCLTSAKTNKNVADFFMDLGKELIKINPKEK